MVGLRIQELVIVLLILLIPVALMVGIPAAILHRKGRNRGMAFLLFLVMGPFAFIGALLMSPAKPQQLPRRQAEGVDRGST